MSFTDFVIQWDNDPVVITKRVLKSIILNRLALKKPAVMFVSGDSGEGKSYSCLRLQELLLDIEGLTLKDYLHDINVYTPIEYPKKLDGLLYDKRLRKIKILCVHEAREVVKAKNWHSFLNQAISDVNAMSRAVKRLCFMIVSQFIRDISTDIRYTLNFYIKVHRPMSRGAKARLQIYILWKDDRDIENPKLRKRRLSGYIVMPNGKYRRWTPKYLELSLPNKEIADKFDEADTNAKTTIIKKKMNKLMKELAADMDVKDDKLNLMVDYYLTNIEALNLVGKTTYGKFKVNKNFSTMHDLTDFEVKEFQLRITNKLKEKFKEDETELVKEYEQANEVV